MSDVFNTKRPLTPEQKIQILVNEQKMRQKNYAALMETTKQTESEARIQDKLVAVDESAAIETQRAEKLAKIQQETMAANRTKGLITLESRLFKEGKELLWKKVLFETVYDSLWVDDPVKENVIGSMYETFESTLDFVKTMSPNSFTSNPTKLLQIIESVVTETAKKAAKRITKEATDDPNSDPDKIKFNLDSDEEEKMDEELADLGNDDIVEKVKDKVLAVVQDEKEAGKKKEKAMKDLDEAKKDEDDEPDDIDDSETDGTANEPDDNSDDDKDDKSSKKKDSDDDDEDSDKKKKDKKKDSDSDNDDEPDEDNSDDDKDDKSSKKKDDDDDEPVTEGLLSRDIPDEFYSVVAKLYGELYKKSKGNNASDTSMKFTKSQRVDVTDYKRLKHSKKGSFERVINVTFDEGKRIVKANGFKLGTAKIMGIGEYYIKPLKSGYCEVRVAEGYKAEMSSNSIGGGYAAGNAVAMNSMGYKYLKQCSVTVWYRSKASKSMKDRYLIEEGIVYGKSESDLILESQIIQKQRRELNRTHGSSIFESLMMYNRVGIESDAIMEGVDLSLDDTMNAAMLETIMQYTILETLNTMKICEFNSTNTHQMRKALLEDMNVLAADNGSGNQKPTRINTLKYKRNNDKKVMTQNITP